VTTEDLAFGIWLVVWFMIIGLAMRPIKPGPDERQP
jgi:hypothetical protein